MKTHGLSKSKLKAVYYAMKSRCLNKNNPQFYRYGGRGITICDDWATNPTSFYTWAINNGYMDGLEINRKDNDGGYSPHNCEWTTHQVNNQNTGLISSRNTTGYRGVFYVCKTNKWVAKISSNNQNYYLGTFDTPIDAAISYNEFIIKNKTYHPLNIITN